MSAQWRFCISRFEQTCFPVRCDFSGRVCVVGLRYAIAGIYLFKVILFAALSRFCEMAAMTICAWVLMTPKYRARCNPSSRFIGPKHYSIRKRCFGINLLKRFCDWRRGRETVQNFVLWRVGLRHWEAVFEHDCELAFHGMLFSYRAHPLLWWSIKRQIDQFGCGLVTGEVAPGSYGATDFRVQRLNCVGRVDQSPDLGRII